MDPRGRCYGWRRLRFANWSLGYASDDFIFVPRSSSAKDYTVSGDQLTLTAATLTRLTGDRSYGVNATLEARFSRGVPGRIDVITYDPPILSNATGTTGEFAIPTQFRGDRLATMEAVYADGGNAGPHNWTRSRSSRSPSRPTTQQA